MIKNKTKISSIFITFLVLFSRKIFAYNKFKSEILVFINLQEIKDPNSNKFYFSRKENKRVKISIPVDSKIEDVIKILNKSGVLKGEKYFHALAETKDYSENIVSGSIHLRGKYSLNKLINTLMIVERETYSFIYQKILD